MNTKALFAFSRDVKCMWARYGPLRVRMAVRSLRRASLVGAARVSLWSSAAEESLVKPVIRGAWGPRKVPRVVRQLPAGSCHWRRRLGSDALLIKMWREGSAELGGGVRRVGAGRQVGGCWLTLLASWLLVGARWEGLVGFGGGWGLPAEGREGACGTGGAMREGVGCRWGVGERREGPAPLRCGALLGVVYGGVVVVPAGVGKWGWPVGAGRLSFF